MNLNIVTVNDASKMTAAIKESANTPAELAVDGKDAKAGATPQAAADDAMSKLVKLVPMPVFGPYLALESLFLASVAGEDQGKVLFVALSAKQWACWVTLVVMAVAVPVYLRIFKVKRTGQLIVTTLGFLVLTLASPGPWQLSDWWHDYFATAALIIMGLVLAMYFASVRDLPQDAMADIIAQANRDHPRNG